MYIDIIAYKKRTTTNFKNYIVYLWNSKNSVFSDWMNSINVSG